LTIKNKEHLSRDRAKTVKFKGMEHIITLESAINYSILKRVLKKVTSNNRRAMK